MSQNTFSKKVLCVGAAHVDRKASAQANVELHTSIPVSVHQTLGGVARNVAENLARLGCEVALVSRIGADQGGEWVRKHSSELGMNVEGLTTSSTRGTASYTALLDRQGEMVLGLADMEIYEELTPDALDSWPPYFFEQHRVWFLDTNLPKETLEAILARKTSQHLVFLDPVSNAKAEKLQGLLSRIDFFFPNRDEAEVLTGMTIRTREDVQRAGEKLCSMGVRNVIITMGAEGVCMVSQGQHAADEPAAEQQHTPELSSAPVPAKDQASEHETTRPTTLFFPALPAAVQDVTGAGDSLLAGFICGFLEKGSLQAALSYGIAAAALTVESAETVRPDLTAALVWGRVEA